MRKTKQNKGFWLVQCLICLILIAVTMLSITIKFTLAEDFREIGVMTAVGMKNR